METNPSALEALEKVRSAHCLSEPELNLLSSALAEIEARRQMDALDAKWEQTTGRFVRRRAKSRGLYIVSTQESLVGALVGICVAAYGAYMVWQFVRKPDDFVLPMVFFCCVTLVGLYVIFSSLGGFRVARDYAAEQTAYQSRRRQLAEQLPAEARLPYRLCPNCLTEQWRTI